MARKYYKVKIIHLDHADVAAAPGSAAAEDEAHGAAAQHPRQPGEVGVDIRLDVGKGLLLINVNQNEDHNDETNLDVLLAQS